MKIMKRLAARLFGKYSTPNLTQKADIIVCTAERTEREDGGGWGWGPGQILQTV